jgi:hypothetical protein
MTYAVLSTSKFMPSKLEALKSLLLREWDPLGLSGCDGADNHYDPYTVRVLEMLTDGTDAAAIASYLNSVVTTEFSVTGNVACDRAIAAKAVAILSLQDDAN